MQAHDSSLNTKGLSLENLLETKPVNVRLSTELEPRQDYEQTFMSFLFQIYLNNTNKMFRAPGNSMEKETEKLEIKINL